LRSQEPGEDITHVAPGLLAAGLLAVDADADVDASVGLGEEPAVERRDVAVEDHLDLLGHELGALPPAHQGRDALLRPRVGGEDRVCAGGAEHEAALQLAAVGQAHPGHALAFSQQLGDVDAALELDAQLAGAFHEQVVELAAQEHHRLGVGGEHHRAPLAGHQPHRHDRRRQPAQLGIDAQLRPELQGVGRQARAAGLVPREVGPIEEQNIAHALLGQGDGRRCARRTGPDDDGVVHGSIDATIAQAGASTGVPCGLPHIPLGTSRRTR